MFFHACYQINFSRLAPVALRLRLTPLALFPDISTGCIFSRAWHRLNIFPRLTPLALFPPLSPVAYFSPLAPVAHFPAIVISCAFTRHCYRWHIFRHWHRFGAQHVKAFSTYFDTWCSQHWEQGHFQQQLRYSWMAYLWSFVKQHHLTVLNLDLKLTFLRSIFIVCNLVYFILTVMYFYFFFNIMIIIMIIITYFRVVNIHFCKHRIPVHPVDSCV